MKSIILFFLIFSNGLVFAQRSYYKDVTLVNQASYKNGSYGLYIKYLKGYLYTICISRTPNSANTENIYYFHFIKFNLSGDTVFTKLIHTDSSISGISDLTVNKIGNGFHFVVSTRSPAVRSTKFVNHVFSLDTLGVSKKRTEVIALNGTKYLSRISNIIIGDSVYSIVIQYNKYVDSVSSYLLSFQDTLIKFQDSIINHDLSNLVRINNNRYVVLETQKEPGFKLPYRGKSFLRFYDSNFSLIKIMDLHGYWNDFDVKITNDTIIILGANTYYAQLSNNYIIYSIKKFTTKGDSLSEFTSRKMSLDTATAYNSLIILNNEYYIGSEKFLFKLKDNALIILKDMRKFPPFAYCSINDSLIGFTGYYGKLSDIGMMTNEGRFLDVKSIINSASTISIYPNPSSTDLLLLDGVLGQYDIKIMNNVGQIVYSQLNQNVLSINTGLPKGMYIVEIKTKEVRNYFKWLIQ